MSYTFTLTRRGIIVIKARIQVTTHITSPCPAIASSWAMEQQLTDNVAVPVLCPYMVIHDDDVMHKNCNVHIFREIMDIMVKGSGSIKEGWAEDGKLCSHLEWPYLFCQLNDVYVADLPLFVRDVHSFFGANVWFSIHSSRGIQKCI